MVGRKQLDLVSGLQQIDRYLCEKDIIGEICIFVGACMYAVFAPAKELRKAIFEVGLKNGWEWNWVNDDVSGFLSKTETDLVKIPEFNDFTHLKILFPEPSYLLAMKCLAARAGSEDEPSQDLKDAIWLCQSLKIKSREEIEQTINRYYPEETSETKTDFFIEELVSRLQS